MKKYIFLMLTAAFLMAGKMFSQTVYTAGTGAHYHTAKCKKVGKASTAMPLSKALAMGFTPCPECKPPIHETKKAAKKKPVKSKSKAPAKKTAAPTKTQ